MATFKRRVAYLKSTGTQWINTGVAPDFAGGDEIEIRYQVNDAVGSKVVFGSRTASVTDGVYATGWSLQMEVRTQALFHLESLTQH